MVRLLLSSQELDTFPPGMRALLEHCLRGVTPALARERREALRAQIEQVFGPLD